jgi:pentatricopeptide repeat protein
MQAAGYAPTLRHCSALLKAFARAGRDDLALATLQMMLGDRDFGELEKLNFSLPCTSPDLIALNTVIKSCAKGNNLDGVMSIFERMQAGEFQDPESSLVISPDQITFHSMLQACRDPKTARDIVKEVRIHCQLNSMLSNFWCFHSQNSQTSQMRLSRRNRYGVVLPTNVTYALAINVCQKAKILDLELVECFLRWAQDDDIQPSVFMYASAIWAAQRDGSCSKALAYFDEMESLGCQPNSVAFDGTISALCGNGEIERAITMYERTRELGNEVSPSTMKVSELQTLVSPPPRETVPF